MAYAVGFSSVVTHVFFLERVIHQTPTVETRGTTADATRVLLAGGAECIFGTGDPRGFRPSVMGVHVRVFVKYSRLKNDFSLRPYSARGKPKPDKFGVRVFCHEKTDRGERTSTIFETR